MATVVITCNICLRLGEKPFETPYDTQGSALMKVHLQDHVEKGEE